MVPRRRDRLLHGESYTRLHVPQLLVTACVGLMVVWTGEPIGENVRAISLEYPIHVPMWGEVYLSSGFHIKLHLHHIGLVHIVSL